MDTSETLAGKRDRALVDTVGKSEGLLRTQEKRSRVGDLYLAFVLDKEVAMEHAHWWNPALKARWNATHASAAGGVDAAISALIG